MDGMMDQRFVEVPGERSASKGARSVRRGAVEDTGHAVRWPPTLLNIPQFRQTGFCLSYVSYLHSTHSFHIIIQHYSLVWSGLHVQRYGLVVIVICIYERAQYLECHRSDEHRDRAGLPVRLSRYSVGCFGLVWCPGQCQPHASWHCSRPERIRDHTYIE